MGGNTCVSFSQKYEQEVIYWYFGILPMYDILDTHEWIFQGVTGILFWQ